MEIQNPPKIFLSYRRKDSHVFTERMHDRLVSTFGFENVFLDVDNNIPTGKVFGDVLVETLNNSDVVLVIIGEIWIDIKDSGGNQRLRNPNDWVRKEVVSSLASDDVQVIPVVIQQAKFPSRDELPDDIKPLLDLQIARVRDNPDFHKDMDLLLQEIKLRATEILLHREKRDYRKINCLLMDTLSYDENDLSLNTSGKLSQQQIERLSSSWISDFGLIFSMLFFVAVFVYFSIIGCMAIFNLTFGNYDSFWTAGALLIVVLALSILVASASQREKYSIGNIKGKLQSVSNLALVIDEKEYQIRQTPLTNISDELVQYVDHDIVIYFAKSKRKPVSAYFYKHSQH